jgi:hypothetical protein
LKKIECSKPENTSQGEKKLDDLIISISKLSALTMSMEVLKDSSWGQDVMESPPSPV